jgi:DNA-binding NarL/FixJ family response regulator
MPPADRAEFDRLVAAARATLGEAVFASVWASGQAMTLEQLQALSEPETPATVVQMVAQSYPAELTEREVEVLRLIAQGLSDAQVAEQLVISPRTVNSHLRTIYSKIEVTSRTAAAHFAYEHGLVS